MDSTPSEALKGGGEPPGVKVRLLQHLPGKVKGKPGNAGQPVSQDVVTLNQNRMEKKKKKNSSFP